MGCLVLQVVAMKRLAEVYDGEPYNFEMVYREYLKFSHKSSMQSFERPVVFKAFDQLMVTLLFSSLQSAYGNASLLLCVPWGWRRTVRF